LVKSAILEALFYRQPAAHASIGRSHYDRPFSTAVANPEGRIRPLLAVIVPTLNEADNIAPLLARIDSALEGHRYEVIFVDDWSGDGTADVVHGIASTRNDVRLLRRFGRSGLSSAVVEGMLSTSATTLAVIDADGQHDETLLPVLAGLVSSGAADLAIASRYLDEGSTGDWSARRVATSKLATRLAQRLLPVQLSDPMSGFFAIRRSTFEAALPRLTATGFKILLDIVLSSPTTLKIAERPYRFGVRTAGESKLDPGVALDYLLLLADKAFRRYAPPRFILFGLVGLCGVAVHLGLLRLGLILLGWPFAEAQTLAVAGAIAFNFTLNNLITFRDRRLKGVRWWLGLASFYAVCGLGAIANVGVGALVFSHDHRWWIAGIAGAAVGSVWNFAASSFLTWRGR
jgi:dolichol-phosphate mannosyltransferase